ACLRLAGQYPRARKRDGARRRARANAGHPARQPADERAWRVVQAVPDLGGGGRQPSRSRVRPRGAREGYRARLYRRGPETRWRRPGEGGGAPRYEFPVLPLLREEVQPALMTISGGPGPPLFVSLTVFARRFAADPTTQASRNQL